MTQPTPNDIHTNVKETVEKRILFTRSSSMQEISRVKHASYYLYKTYSIWFFLSRSTPNLIILRENIILWRNRFKIWVGKDNNKTFEKYGILK